MYALALPTIQFLIATPEVKMQAMYHFQYHKSSGDFRYFHVHMKYINAKIYRQTRGDGRQRMICASHFFRQQTCLSEQSDVGTC